MRKKKVLYIVLVLGLLGLVGCGQATPGPTETPTEIPTEEPGGDVGMANPASVNCEEQGYTLELRTDANGTYGVCIFPDGSECEEWAYFRGECAPGESVMPEEIGTPDEPTDVLAPSVSYAGVSFSYDASLATGVTPETVAAVGPELVVPHQVAPEHLRFSFDGYVIPEAFFEPQINIYPVAGFAALHEQAAVNVSNLQQLLVDRPAVLESIPFLPLPGGPLSLRVQVAYIDFQNGTGVRSVLWGGQGTPVNNRELFYTFQGLTDDGEYYVSARLPVTHATLPADGFEIPGDDLQAFMANFDAHLSEVELQLGAEDPASFVPDLGLLDQMMASLVAMPEQLGTGEVVTTPPSGDGDVDPYAGWGTFTSATFGYTLRYPENCQIMGADHSASVQFVGPLVGNEHWPWFFVDHYDSDFYHPPQGTDLLQWIQSSVLSYDEIDTNATIAGLPAVHVRTYESPQAYGSDDYYVAKDGQLYHIQILHAGGQQDWALYDLFLQGFSFPDSP